MGKIHDVEGNKNAVLKKAFVVDNGVYTKLPKAFLVEDGKYVKFWSALSNKFISFVYWGMSGSSAKYSLYTSDDSVTWSPSIDGVSLYYDCKVVRGNGVCIYYQYNKAYVTSDCKTFTLVTLPFGQNVTSTITFEDGVFYGVTGSSGQGSYEGTISPTFVVYSSPDGINWTKIFGNTYGYFTYSNGEQWNVPSEISPNHAHNYLVKGTLGGVNGMHIIMHYMQNYSSSYSNLYWVTSTDGGKTWYASTNYASTRHTPIKDKDGNIYIIKNAASKRVEYIEPTGRSVTMQCTSDTYTGTSSYGMTNVAFLHDQDNILVMTRTNNGMLEIHTVPLGTGTQSMTKVASIPSATACRNFPNYALRVNEDFMCFWSRVDTSTYQGAYSKDGVTWTVFDQVLESGRLGQSSGYLFTVIPSD